MDDTLQKLDRGLRAALPVGVCLFFILLMLVPWPFPHARQLLSLVVFMALCHWVVHAPDYFSMRWSFIIGFLQDVLLGQPLGISALTYLAADFFLRTQRLFFLQQSFRHFWMVFAAMAALISLAQWGVAHVFMGQGVSMSSLLLNIVTGILLFPLISVVLHGIQRLLLSKG